MVTIIGGPWHGDVVPASPWWDYIQAVDPGEPAEHEYEWTDPPSPIGPPVRIVEIPIVTLSDGQRIAVWADRT
jgi:hypothetical protein